MSSNLATSSQCSVINFPTIEVSKHNYNKDISQEVFPLRDMCDINKFKNFFLTNKQYRNYALFTFGINTGLRCGDIVSLQWKNIIDINGNLIPDFIVREEKTGKFRKIHLNQITVDALLLYMNHIKKDSVLTSFGYVFSSFNHMTEKLEVNSVYRMLKRTAKDIDICFNIGTHTMRKTWGYHQYKIHSESNPRFIYELQKMFGHDSSDTTLSYIGITDEKHVEYYDDVNL